MKSILLTLGLLIGAALATVSDMTPRHHGRSRITEDFHHKERRPDVVEHHGPMHRGVVGNEPTTYKVEVDEEEIDEIINDFREFGQKYITRTKAERIALMHKLKEAFRNTGAKIILNFGKTIPPLVKSWAQVMKHVQVDDRCD
jgi:wyosine [tRNA(Phe)-imidazoG37] synthetase (radical SAM superfamily)